MAEGGREVKFLSRKWALRRKKVPSNALRWSWAVQESKIVGGRKMNKEEKEEQDKKKIQPNRNSWGGTYRMGCLVPQ